MKVYSIKIINEYCGGMAIVAAENKIRARSLANEIDSAWHISYNRSNEIKELDLQYEGEEKVIDHFEFGE